MFSRSKMISYGGKLHHNWFFQFSRKLICGRKFNSFNILEFIYKRYLFRGLVVDLKNLCRYGKFYDTSLYGFSSTWSFQMSESMRRICVKPLQTISFASLLSTTKCEFNNYHKSLIMAFNRRSTKHSIFILNFY